MPTFDFFRVTTKKEKVVKRENSDTGKYTIIEKNIDGIVHISIEGNYYVKVDKTYNITSENYTCNDMPYVYAQQLDEKGHRIMLARADTNANKLPKQYLPFAPGIQVYGNIVKNNYTTEIMFKIKKICYDERTDEGLEALQFYKRNYGVIQDGIRNKWKD